MTKQTDDNNYERGPKLYADASVEAIVAIATIHALACTES